MKKKRRPFLWLILIPAQLVLGLLFFRFGVYLDVSIANSAREANPDLLGHAAPMFTIFFAGIALLVTTIVFILSITGFIITFVRKIKEEKKDHKL